MLFIHKSPTPLRVPPSAGLLEPRSEKITVFLQGVLLLEPGSGYHSVKRELISEPQFWISLWKNHQMPVQDRALYIPEVQRGDSRRLSEPDYYCRESIHIQPSKEWGVGGNQCGGLTESVTLDSLKRASQMEILGKSLPRRLTSKHKGPGETACSKNTQRSQHD